MDMWICIQDEEHRGTGNVCMNMEDFVLWLHFYRKSVTIQVRIWKCSLERVAVRHKDWGWWGCGDGSKLSQGPDTI